jgi:hypothetical protein
MTNSASAIRPVHLALLAVTVLVGTLLRLYNLNGTSFWSDEICTVLYERGRALSVFAPPTGYFDQAPAIASHAGTRPLSNVWTSFDSNPPMYPTVLRFWWMLFGDSDVSARVLSVLVSVLTILTIFDFCRLMTSPRVALWACALCAVSPEEVMYAREARPYALVGLLGVIACDAAIRIHRFGGSVGRYLVLFLICVAALLTHFFIIGAIAGIAAFALVAKRGRDRIWMIGVVVAALCVELWAIPVMLHVVAIQGHRGGLDWLAESRAGLTLRTFVRAASLPMVYLTKAGPAVGLLNTPSVLVLLLPLWLYRKEPGFVLASLWSTCLIGFVVATDLWYGHNATHIPRYTLAAAPMVFLLFAKLSESAGRWTAHALPLIVVLIGLLTMPKAYHYEILAKTESGKLAADVSSHVRANDVLVFMSQPDKDGYWSAAGLEYIAIDFYTNRLPCAVAILEQPARGDDLKNIWSHAHLWVVEAGDGTEDADAQAYLGPCSIIPVAGPRYCAGRLFQANGVH